MAKADPGKLGKAAPRVEWEDLEDDVAVVTIAAYEEGEVDDAEAEEGKRATVFLMFEELGDKRLYLNVGQMKALIHRFGDEMDKWIGQKVPIEKVTARFGKQSFKKVYVMTDPDEWDEYVPRQGRRTARSATAKRGRKKARRR